MVYVVKLWLQMVINTPEKQGYYTFASIKPWTMVHFRILIIKNILNINWAIQHLTMLKKAVDNNTSISIIIVFRNVTT